MTYVGLAPNALQLKTCAGSYTQQFTFDSGRIKRGSYSIGVAGGCSGITETIVQMQSSFTGGGCESQQKWNYNEIY